MKELLEVANVPTAAYGTFRDVDDALAMLHSMTPPYVIKTDGLAAGKGVLVTDSRREAEHDVREKLSGQSFGEAGGTIVIEEGLVGDECSLLVLVDGTRAVALPPAQDFKRVGDGGTGPNTGGMGAFAPLSTMSIPLVDDVMTHMIEPTLRELRRRGVDYRGVLYAGLMLTGNGPKLLEYNVRFGDPETQALIPLIADDLDQLLIDASTGGLHAGPALHPGGSVTVVLAARGYPTTPRYGDVITGLGADGQLAAPLEGVTVFHAGTRLDDEGRFVTAGGRVLAITATGPSVAAARGRAYEATDRVQFEGRQMRTDIASAHG